MLIPLAACGRTQATSHGGISIIATLFPQYDFARQIAGGRADVLMLLPPGVESHTFEPKPSDMQAIHSADLFLYTGDEMEPWAARVIAGADNTRALDLSHGIDMITPPDHDHSDHAGDDHDHDDHDHDDHDDQSGHDSHEHAADPHIWLDLRNAAHMVGAIADALCDIDPDGASVYRANADTLTGELLALDTDFEQMIAGRTRDSIVFGGRFAYLYFLTRYNLPYETAYESCGASAEPSMQKIASVISYVKEHDLPVVYHEELTDPIVARTIAQQAGAELMLFSTAHNVTKDEFESGITFIDVMRQNYDNLKAGLY